MRRKKIAIIAFLSLLFIAAVPFSIFAQCGGSGQDQLFVTRWNNTNYERLNIDGTNPVTLSSTFGRNYVIEASPDNGFRYMSSLVDSVITRSLLNGSGETTLYNTTPLLPFQVRIDVQNNKIYWSEWNNNANIICSNLDGTGTPTAILSGLSYPSAMDIDTDNGFIYYVNGYSNPATINRATIDNNCGAAGTPSVLTSFGGFQRLFSMVLDAPNNRMYWANYDNQTIGVGDLNGNIINGSLWSTSTNPTSVDIHKGSNQLYWISRNGVVETANADGSAALSTVYSTSNLSWGLEICEENLNLLSFTSTTADATYGAGSTINITATYDDNLTPSSSLTVQLDNGVSVLLDSLSGAEISGTYTVGSGEDSSDLTVSSIISESVTSAVNGTTQSASQVPASPNNIADTSDIVIDVTPPILSEINPVSDPTIDTTPAYTYSSSEAGAAVFSGDCNSANTTVSAGNNAIVLDADGASGALLDGTYSNCTITVTDAVGNVSTALNISPFRIASTPPTLTLNVNNSSIAENGGVATFTATLDVIYGLSVTIDLAFSGSAGAGDYTQSGSQIVISPGNLNGSITLTGDDDSLDENNETVIVEIISVTNGSESGTQQETTSILDDDAPPSVTLTMGSSTISEAGGSTNFTATLSAISGRNVTANLGFSGTALPGDYTASNTQIVIGAGSLNGSISVSAIDNSTYEGNKTVVVDISSLSNGSENGTQQQTTTIVEDEIVSPGGQSAGLTVWYKTSAISGASDGDQINPWSDQSANTNNGVQTNANRRPTYQDDEADEINFNPVLSFDGGNDYYHIPNTVDINLIGSKLSNSIYTVFKTGTDILSRQVIFEEGAHIRGLNIYIFNGELYCAAWNLPNDGVGSSWVFTSTKTAISANKEYLLSYIYRGNDAETGTVDCYLDGSLVSSATNVGRLYAHSGDIALGAKRGTTYFETGVSNGTGNYFEANFSEFNYYQDIAHSGAEQNRVESYLAIKYGFTLEQSTATDYVAHDGTVVYDADGSHLSYNNDIAGIAIDNGSMLVQVKSKSLNSDAIVTMQETGSLGDGEFLLWGNDNDDNGLIEEISTGLSSAHAKRLDRVWRVDKEGTPGNIQVEFDLSGTTVTGSSSSDFVLLVDSLDSDFSSGATAIAASSFSSNIVTFASVNFSADSYFTLVTSVNFAPTLLSLTSSTSDSTYGPGSNINITADYDTSLMAGSSLTVVLNNAVSVTLNSVSGSQVFATYTVGATGSAEDILDLSVSNISVENVTSTTGFSQSSSSIPSGSNIGDTSEINIDVTAPSLAEVTPISTPTVDTTPDYTYSSNEAGVGAFSGGCNSTNTSVTNGNNTATLDSDGAGGALADGSYSACTVTVVDAVGNTSAALSITTFVIASSEPSVTLSVNTTNIFENSGVATFTVTLNSIYGLSVVVDLGFSGSASFGGDYTVSSSQITVSAGSTSGNITLSAMDDTMYEGDEDAIVDITSVTNGSESGTQQETVTIVEDDVACNLDPYVTPIGTSGFLEFGADAIYDPNEAGYSDPNSDDFDTMIMGRDSTGVAARRALAVSYFLNKFGVDFSASNFAQGGDVIMAQVSGHTPWGFRAHVASDYRITKDSPEVYTGYYAMFVIGSSATLGGTWGGAGGVVVDFGTVAEFGEYVVDLPIPCTDSSVMIERLYFEWESNQPTFTENSVFPNLFDDIVTSTKYGIGTSQGRKEHRLLVDDTIHSISTMIIQFP